MSTPAPLSHSEQVFAERYPDTGLTQCRATSRQTGDRCGQPAIRGGTVCQWHGGANATVKAKANKRLLELVDPALARLAQIIETGPDAQAVRAANSILDRAGIVRRTDIDPAAATALLVERLKAIIDAREHPIIEGSVIDDDDPTR